MKKLFWIILTVVLFTGALFCISASANGSTVTVGNLTFTEYDTYCAVTGYNSVSGSITIPSSVNFSGTALPVTQIGKNAFYGCSSLTSVTIPDSVTSIGSQAFHDCKSLIDVTLGSNVTIIGELAFQTCSKLESINFPENVEIIGRHAFYGCKSLNSIVLPYGLKSIGDNAFVYCAFSNVIIPDSVTSLGQSAFQLCSNLKSITLSKNITTIERYTFKDCSSLESIDIPNSVTQIKNEAFYGCNSLAFNEYDNALYLGNVNNPYYALIKAKNDYITNVVINDRTNLIDYAAFSNCRSLKYNEYDNGLYLGNTNNPYLVLIKAKDTSIESININDNTKIIYGYAFYRCSNLTNVTIPSSVTSIGYEAFYYCSGLTSITLPDSVTLIGDEAFQLCSCLTNVTIPNSVTSIGNSAFSNCSSLTSATIPDSVTSIGNYAFSGCSSLTSVTIPDSVTSIGDSAFYDCSSLIRVTIPDSVINIGNWAFSGCSSLTEINIPYGITAIGYRSFYNCKNLKNITIPESVISIGTEAFCNCSSLTSIVIPDNVELISSNAFSNCSGLTSITIPFVGGSISQNTYFGYLFGATYYSDNNKYVPSSLKEVIISDKCSIIPDNAFYGCKNLTDVILEEGVKSIGRYAFSSCTGLTLITIPSSVTSIGGYAFSGCSSLIGINITDLAEWCKINFPDCYSNPLYDVHNLYVNGTLVTDLVIPDGVKMIGDMSFYFCSSLKSVTIPDSVVSIGKGAFSVCNNLTSITIPFVGESESVNTYLGHIFGAGNSSNSYNYVPSSLKEVIISDKCKAIPNYAFYGCDKLNIITVSNNVMSIGNYAFASCANLSKITIPDGVTSIGNYAFYYCYGLSSIIIPDSVTSIGEYAFYYCRNLNNIIIPDSVVTIGVGALSSCNSLKSVTVPFIGGSESSNMSFGYLFGTTNVSYNSGAAPSELREVVISDKCKTIPINALYNFDKITSVVIGKGVASIGNNAFYGCSSLNRVKYTGTPKQWNNVTIGSGNNVILNATIGYKTTLSATADIGNISIEPSGELFTHDEIKLKADNLLNYRFIGWFDGEKIVSTSTVYTFEITGDTVLTAKFEAVTAPVTVTVNCENGAEYTVTNNTSGGNDIFVGDSITIAAKDASKVLQWQNASGKVLGRGGSLTITVGGDTEITLIYKAEGAGQAYVQFVSGSGQVFSAGLYGSGDAVSFPDAPTKLGYTFDKWIIDGTDKEATEDNIKSLFSSNKSLTVKPSYTELTTEFTVTVKYSGVNREDVVSSERIGSGFSVEAPEISGFVFQNWTDETGKILSYKNNYYVQVSKDITLIAVYGNEAPVALPVITISGISKVDENGTHKMTASATRSIPDGYELVEHGVLYARDVDGLDETTFVYGTPGVSKYISNKTMQNGVVKLNVKVDNDDVVVSMRGYMILKKNGVLSIYYTDIVSGKYGA